MEGMVAPDKLLGYTKCLLGRNRGPHSIIKRRRIYLKGVRVPFANKKSDVFSIIPIPAPVEDKGESIREINGVDLLCLQIWGGSTGKEYKT